MASINDNAVMVGKESTYGTPVALSRAYEAKTDTYQIVKNPIESVGMRAASTAKRSDRIVLVNGGAEGTLDMDIQNKGFGLVGQALLGSVTGPTQQAATTAYLQTYTATSDEPGDFYTVQILRTDASGTQQAYTHHGGIITGWTLAHSVDGNLMVDLDFDFEDYDTSTGAGTPAYASDTVPFDWTMASFTVGGNSLCVTDFELTADLSLKTDRFCMRGNELKKQPVRQGIPTFTGSITAEYDGTTIFDLFAAESPVAIVGTWTGATIEGAYDYEITVTMPACLLTGSAPVVSLTDMPTITIPFEALDNGSAAVTMTYQSDDTSL